MRALVIAAALAVGLAAWQWWDGRSVEAALGPVASAVAGRDVDVDCQGFWGSLVDAQSRHGEVRFGADGRPEARIFLTRATCRRLDRFSGRTRHPELDCLLARETGTAFGDACYEESSRTVYAVLVLAHEAVHAAGIADERTANCYAVQALGYVASELGAPPAEAHAVARAMASWLPHQGADYGTAACRAGSHLDLRPDTRAFPTESLDAPPRLP